jgi:hypothetical protein
MSIDGDGSVYYDLRRDSGCCGCTKTGAKLKCDCSSFGVWHSSRYLSVWTMIVLGWEDLGVGTDMANCVFFKCIFNVESQNNQKRHFLSLTRVLFWRFVTPVGISVWPVERYLWYSVVECSRLIKYMYVYTLLVIINLILYL